MNFILLLVLPRPVIMKLKLGGKVKKLYEHISGIYMLESNLVNSYPYWIQQNGDRAIWYDEIGKKWNLGHQKYNGRNGWMEILGPFGNDKPPSQIFQHWKYYDNSWIEASHSDIIFEDLSTRKNNFHSYAQ